MHLPTQVADAPPLTIVDVPETEVMVPLANGAAIVTIDYVSVR